jgi:hypothetical protein
MQFGSLGGSLRDGRRDFCNLRGSVQNRRFEHDTEQSIGSASDLNGAVTILKSGFGGSHGPRAARDVLEIGDSAGLRGSCGDLPGAQADPDLSIEDSSLLGVLDEDPQFAGLAGLGGQLMQGDQQQDGSRHAQSKWNGRSQTPY